MISSTFSACVRTRAHHAAEVYRRGLAAHIITTGGFTGPPPSEAGAMSGVLQADGVPASAITLEEQARDTIQNIQRSKAIMAAQGWHSAIIVTEPHHIKRATLIARNAGIIVYSSPATDSPSWRIPTARSQNQLRDVYALMVYQFGRLLAGSP